MQYKEKDGKLLYGFSQENLERTNREIKKTNRYLQMLILLLAVVLILIISALTWLEINNVFTRLIYN
ncbi:MAG: hypothetical protein AABW64_02450 [Nanoarchaeota archaeon]